MESHDLSPSSAPQVSLRGDKSARADGPPPPDPSPPRHPKVRVRTGDRWWPSFAIGRGVKMCHKLNSVSICLPAPSPCTTWAGGLTTRPSAKIFSAAQTEQGSTHRRRLSADPPSARGEGRRSADYAFRLRTFSINIIARLLPHVTNANPCNRLNLYNSPISGIQLDHITATTENSREHKNVNLYLRCSRATELIWETELRQGFSSVPACSAHISKC